MRRSRVLCCFLAVAGLLGTALVATPASPARAAATAPCAVTPHVTGLNLTPSGLQYPTTSTAHLLATAVPLKLKIGATVSAKVICGPDTGEHTSLKVTTYAGLTEIGPNVPAAKVPVTNRGGPGTDVVSVTVGSGSSVVGPATAAVTFSAPVDCNLPTSDLGYIQALKCQSPLAKRFLKDVYQGADCLLGVASFLAPETKLAKLIPAAEAAAKGITADKLAKDYKLNIWLVKIVLSLKDIRRTGGTKTFDQAFDLVENASSVPDFLERLKTLSSEVASAPSAQRAALTKDFESIAADALHLVGLGSCLDILAKIPALGSPAIATKTLPGGTVGDAYNALLKTTDGRDGTWSASGLPAGLALDGGAITGSPTVVGTSSVTIKFIDDTVNHKTASVSLSLHVEDVRAGSWASDVLTTAPSGDADTFAGVSCPQPGTCVGVGQWVDPGGKIGGGPLIGVLKSGAWTFTKLDGSIAPDGSQDAALTHISCKSMSFCVAVGYDFPYDEGQVPLEATLQGDKWTVADLPLPPDFTYPEQNGWGYGVSCPAVGQCVAVSRTGNADSVQAVTDTLADGTWSPSELDISGLGLQDALFDGVSCWSVGNCVAVGDGDGTDQNGYLVVGRETSGTWVYSTTLGYIDARSVSCGAPADCVAFGGSLSTWAVAVTALTMTPVTYQVGGWGGVSCATSTFCAFGSDGADGSGRGILTVETNGVATSVTESSADYQTFDANDVSCPSTTWCLAVGRAATTAGVQYPLTFTYSVN